MSTDETNPKPPDTGRIARYTDALREGSGPTPGDITVEGPVRSGQHRLASLATTLAPTAPANVGGHRIERARTRKGEQQQWTCVDCHTTGPHGLFTVIGQRDFCPERVDSMNGYIWFNADDPDHQPERAARQWESYARRCGFAVEDFQESTSQPGICATFTWREQPYRIRYGADEERGMRRNDIRVEPVEENAEQAGA